MEFFRWIEDRITSNVQNVVWVVGGLGVVSQQIEKNTINFKGKALWTLAQHRLCSTIGDNVLSLVWTAMIAGFIDSYEFDVCEFLAQEWRNLAVGGVKSLFAITSLMFVSS
ncbi:hypothetical protein FXO37_10360 [Capsicum annuum]|nr:hypothetical protein FXO37_10360 [Capsicum annuum]